MSAKDLKRWRDWYNDHRDYIVHPILDREDWKPFASEIMRQILDHVRHPRAALRASMLKAAVVGIQLQHNYL
jgi:hypothetical protein